MAINDDKQQEASTRDATGDEEAHDRSGEMGAPEQVSSGSVMVTGEDEPHPSDLGGEEIPWLPRENTARLETHELRAKGEPRPNPTDFSISLRAKFGSDQQILRPGRRHQRMRGFEEQYTDIIDFIVRATHRVALHNSVDRMKGCTNPKGLY